MGKQALRELVRQKVLALSEQDARKVAVFIASLRADRGRRTDEQGGTKRPGRS